MCIAVSFNTTTRPIILDHLDGTIAIANGRLLLHMSLPIRIHGRNFLGRDGLTVDHPRRLRYRSGRRTAVEATERTEYAPRPTAGASAAAAAKDAAQHCLEWVLEFRLLLLL